MYHFTRILTPKRIPLQSCMGRMGGPKSRYISSSGRDDGLAAVHMETVHSVNSFPKAKIRDSRGFHLNIRKNKL